MGCMISPLCNEFEHECSHLTVLQLGLSLPCYVWRQYGMNKVTPAQWCGARKLHSCKAVQTMFCQMLNILCIFCHHTSNLQMGDTAYPSSLCNHTDQDCTALQHIQTVFVTHCTGQDRGHKGRIEPRIDGHHEHLFVQEHRLHGTALHRSSVLSSHKSTALQ